MKYYVSKNFSYVYVQAAAVSSVWITVATILQNSPYNFLC